MFGKVQNQTDVTLEVTTELGGKQTVTTFEVGDFPIDVCKLETPAADDLVGYEEPKLAQEFDGTSFSFQANVQKTGRYVKFKYFSSERFCIGNTYAFIDKMKPFISEPTFTA